MTRLPVLAALGASLIALGTFLYVSRAASYAGTQAATCNNCHVMDAMYENWYHAAHEPWAVCVDCHLPHYNPVHYYFEKARTGFHDVYVFGSGLTPALIRAGPDSEDIIQDNCIRCHAPAVEEIMAGVQPMDRNCWDCHRNVAHGPRGLSFVPYQDSILYPVK